MSPKLPGRSRAAYALGLGLARDRGSVSGLTARLTDESEDASCRGFSALALGLIGQADEATRNHLRSALRREAPIDFRLHVATALTQLGDEEAGAILAAELRTPTDPSRRRAQTARRYDALLALSVTNDRSAADVVQEMAHHGELTDGLFAASPDGGNARFVDLRTATSFEVVTHGVAVAARFSERLRERGGL